MGKLSILMVLILVGNCFLKELYYTEKLLLHLKWWKFYEGKCWSSLDFFVDENIMCFSTFFLLCNLVHILLSLSCWRLNTGYCTLGQHTTTAPHHQPSLLSAYSNFSVWLISILVIIFFILPIWSLLCFYSSSSLRHHVRLLVSIWSLLPLSCPLLFLFSFLLETYSLCWPI